LGELAPRLSPPGCPVGAFAGAAMAAPPVPKVDVGQALDYRPARGLHGEFWHGPPRSAVFESSYSSGNVGAVEALQSARPARRFPSAAQRCGVPDAPLSARVGGTGLADAGRAALGMSAASGDHVIASPPRCRAAQLLSPAPPSHPLTASCRTDRAGVCTTYRETYATSAGPTIDEHEFEGPVDKTHHVKRNEMIQVARMQAQMKTLMR